MYFKQSGDVSGDATSMLGRLGAWGEPNELVTPVIVLVIGLMLLSQFVPISRVRELQFEYGRLPWAVQGALFGVGLVLVDVLGPEGVAPFIYFQF